MYKTNFPELAAVPPTYEHPRGITLLIPVRNETPVLPALMDNLRALNLPAGCKILFIDDDSDDDSVSLIRQGQFNVTAAQEKGKKAALETGIESVSTPYIFTIDADCLVNPDVLNSYQQQIRPGLKMIIGPVLAVGGKGIAAWLHRGESVALLYLTRMAVKLGIPFLCNGANLLFSGEVFEHVGGYKAHKSISSGDDVLLLRAFAKEGPAGISFSEDPRSLVLTAATSGYDAWIRQRLRWMSKSGHVWGLHRNILMIGMLVQLFLPWLLLPVLWPLGVFVPFAEYILIWPLARRLGFSFYIGDWFFFRFLYPLACVVLLVSALFVRPRWKGRIIQR